MMGGNPRTTFAKRQKERARQEKQAEKAQKRAQRGPVVPAVIVHPPGDDGVQPSRQSV